MLLLELSEAGDALGEKDQVPQTARLGLLTWKSGTEVGMESSF